MALTVGVPLASDHAAAIEDLFRRLRARTELRELPRPTPHLSLLVVLDAPPLDVVDDLLGDVARRTTAFSARARGYGVFADELDELVLYAPVVRSDALAQLHRNLFEAFTKSGARIDGHYHPDTWLPHVTLFHRHLTPERLGEIVASLATTRMITWRLTVDHLARFGPDFQTSTVSLRT